MNIYTHENKQAFFYYILRIEQLVMLFLLLPSSCSVPLNSQCWVSFTFKQCTRRSEYIIQSESFLPSGNCLLFKCIPDALTVFVSILICFLLICIIFFNQLRPVVFCVK